MWKITCKMFVSSIRHKFIVTFCSSSWNNLDSFNLSNFPLILFSVIEHVSVDSLLLSIANNYLEVSNPQQHQSYGTDEDKLLRWKTLVASTAYRAI